jgi:hypothetical protein
MTASNWERTLSRGTTAASNALDRYIVKAPPFTSIVVPVRYEAESLAR